MQRQTASEPIVSTYREYQPVAELSEYVECFWTHESATPQLDHRVMPDGCSDLLFTEPSDGRNELLLVGTMTRAAVFDLPRGRFLGVRFRPGMAPSLTHLPGKESVDQRLPLAEIWGAKAIHLRERLLASASIKESMALIEAGLVAELKNQSGKQRSPNSAQRVLQWAEEARGIVRVDDLADRSGLSTRQLRRLCLDLTGLTPKQLCRAIRFRHAAVQTQLARRGEWAQLALDCGYYDQAHFINEFRALSGLTPSEYCALGAP